MATPMASASDDTAKQPHHPAPGHVTSGRMTSSVISRSAGFELAAGGAAVVVNVRSNREQADSVVKEIEKAGGAGLGLALAKSWAEVLGARLSYRPADGGTGACFRLELPGK